MRRIDRVIVVSQVIFRRLDAPEGSSIKTRGVVNCCDNASMGSFFGSLKNELVHRTTFPARAAARHAIFSDIESFYHRRRCHSGLGFLPPIQSYEHMAQAA